MESFLYRDGRLHAEGGSLREISESLGLSHQRVHQLVEGDEGGAAAARGGADSDGPAAGADPAEAATPEPMAEQPMPTEPMTTEPMAPATIGEMMVGSTRSETKICRPGMRSRNNCAIRSPRTSSSGKAISGSA